MSLNSRIKPNQLPSGSLPISGTAPQTVSDSASQHFVKMVAVDLNSLSANVSLGLTTSSLAITAQWQASDNASTWVNCAGAPNCPANVTIATGTGSLVTTTVICPAPNGVYGKRYVRLVLITAGATGAGSTTDSATLSYNWRLPNAFNA